MINTKWLKLIKVIALLECFYREYQVKFLALSVSKKLRGFQNPLETPIPTPLYMVPCFY